MKKHVLGFILTFIVFNLSGQPLQLWDGVNTQSVLFESSGNIALGTTTPLGTFHIYNNSLSTKPLFLVNIYSPNDDEKISFLYNDGTINYGIRQQGPLYKNIFEGNVILGRSVNVLDLSSQSFRTRNISSFKWIFDQSFTSYDFEFDNSVTPSTPLSINYDGINVTKISTNAFQLKTNPAAGYVLVSDVSGNASWADPSLMGGGSGEPDDDWFRTLETDTGEDPPPTQQPDLYLNPKYGRVGVGTNTPKSLLHVEDGNLLFSRTGHTGYGTCLFGDRWTSDNPVGQWGIQYKIDDDTTSGLNFKRMYGTGRTAVDYCLYIRNDGRVGIGTSAPQSELSVNGKITAKEIEVLITGWPDYVFDQSYKKLSLPEVEQYITINKRLPGVPSAKEIEERGLNLGDMNTVMMEKIEELTLYIIELKKEIEELKSSQKK